MAFAASCLADIGYKVKALPEQQRLEVTMTVPVTSSTTALQVPSWSPGAYVLRDFAAGIKDIRFTSEAGKELAFTKPEAFTWNVDTANVKSLTAKYWVANNPADGAMHYSGPPTYLYVVDRKTEPCLLTFDLPHGWLAVLGIDERRDGSYRAEDYDVLADNPVTMGDFLMDSYSARGKPHYIVYRGRLKQHIDREFVMRMCRQVTESQAEFFGGLPYSKYVWHFSVSPAMSGGGGLEHLSSTQIGLAVGVGPSTMYLCAHEFFHLWNVKRIRSYPLGPFDYTQLPKTGALWWLEGVTDYYASLLPTRTGWFGRDEFYRQVESNVNRTRSNEERLKVSTYDASYRVGEANNGRGNSSGFGVNYYNTQNGAAVEVLGWDNAVNDGVFAGNFESTDDGRRLAEVFFDEGCDIIMPVAGPVGLGSAAAAQERGLAVIGVDTDSFVSAPEFADVWLTSVVKKMDVAVFDTIKAAMDGTLTLGDDYLGTLVLVQRLTFVPARCGLRSSHQTAKIFSGAELLGRAVLL